MNSYEKLFFRHYLQYLAEGYALTPKCTRLEIDSRDRS